MTLEEVLKSKGLTDDQIKAVTAAMKENKIFLAKEEGIDQSYAKLKADHETLTKQHGEATALIEELKKSGQGDGQLQQKITAYEGQVAALQEELQKTKLESAVKMALFNAKATDVDYLSYKLQEKGPLTLDEKGNVKGIEDMLAGLKTQYPQHFGTDGKKIIDEHKLPPTGGSGAEISQADFDKMGYQGRLKLKQENPEAYAQFTGKTNN